MKKVFAICLTLTLLLALLVPAMAADEKKKPPVPIDTSAEVSLKVNFAPVSQRDEDVTLKFKDVDVSVYQVAKISRTGVYTVTDAFLPYCIKVDLNANNSASDLAKLAGTLKADVYEDKIAAAATGTTGADGSVAFTGLEQGLYLVLAKQNGEDDGDTYKPTANLISLPTASADGSAWQYAVETNVKFTYEAAPTPSPEPSEEPTPTPTPTPSPEPSEEPTPTPTPTPFLPDEELYNLPTPTPTATPEPSPEPSEEPEESPEPSEEPEESPEPSETPEETPVPTDKPETSPAPTEPTEPTNPDGEPDEEPAGSTHITAHKMWDDGDDEAGERPSEIVVHLWCDGERYDEIVLSEANGWTMDWDELPDGHDWIISERRESGYALSLERVGSTYLMTNTFDEELFALDEAGVPRGRRNGDDEEYEEFGDEVPRGRLAQTGMLWWPVMLLAAAGIICCMVGFVILRKRSE